MNIMSRASGLILNIFLVRMFTPDGFGVFDLFQNLMEKITAIIRVGGLEASTHVLVATSDERNIKPTPSLLSVPLLIRISFCLIFASFLIFPTYIAVNILKQPALIPYMHFFVFACVACALIVYIIFFGVKIQSTYSIKNLLMRIIPFIIMSIFATLAINFIQPVIIRFSVSAISTILLVYVFWKTALLHEEKIQLKNYLEQLPFYQKFNTR